MLNLSGRIGGDSGLSPRGAEYGKKLAEFIKSQEIPDLKVSLLHCSYFVIKFPCLLMFSFIGQGRRKFAKM